MKKLLLILLILVVASGTSFARGGGGHGGGGHGGGGRGGGGHWGGGGGHHGGYHGGYDRGWHGRGGYGGWRYSPGWGGGYWGGGCNNVGFGINFGSAASSMFVDTYVPSQTVYVQEVAPVVQPAYIDVDTTGARSVITCPKCGQQVDCTGVPRGSHASCPYCKRIMY